MTLREIVIELCKFIGEDDYRKCDDSTLLVFFICFCESQNYEEFFEKFLAEADEKENYEKLSDENKIKAFEKMKEVYDILLKWER